MKKLIKKLPKPNLNKKPIRKIKKFTPVKYILSLITIPIDILKIIIQIPTKGLGFLQSVKNELKLVTWLSKKATARWSFGVIMTSVLTGVSITLLDIGFFELRELLFKIK